MLGFSGILDFIKFLLTVPRCRIVCPYRIIMNIKIKDYSGHRLIRARARFFITQAELAARMGTSQPYLSLIELGKQSMTHNMRAKFDAAVKALEKEHEEKATV